MVCLIFEEGFLGSSALGSHSRRAANDHGVHGVGRLTRNVSRMARACSCLPCSSSLRASCAHSSLVDA